MTTTRSLPGPTSRRGTLLRPVLPVRSGPTPCTDGSSSSHNVFPVPDPSSLGLGAPRPGPPSRLEDLLDARPSTGVGWDGVLWSPRGDLEETPQSPRAGADQLPSRTPCGDPVRRRGGRRPLLDPSRTPAGIASRRPGFRPRERRTLRGTGLLLCVKSQLELTSCADVVSVRLCVSVLVCVCTCLC